MSFRALEVLKLVDIIACEDTRVSSKLLSHYQIKDKKLLSHHKDNENHSYSGIIDLLENNKNVALISDAGYPLISDPGYKLVNGAIEKNIEIIALPGSSSIFPALILSGFATDRFIFLGFPPQKKGRKTFITNALNQNFTTILFESVHRIVKLIEEINLIDQNREISISREISKIYEETIRGNANLVLEKLKEKQNIKGEFVVTIKGKY